MKPTEKEENISKGKTRFMSITRKTTMCYGKKLNGKLEVIKRSTTFMLTLFSLNLNIYVKNSINQIFVLIF